MQRIHFPRHPSSRPLTGPMGLVVIDHGPGCNRPLAAYHVLMRELTADNLPDYLLQRGWIGPGPVHVEALGGGVSNAVLRVQTPERAFVVKQSRPQLRTRDAWFSDLDRVYREQEVMQALGPLLPPETVPEVLFVDRENFAFAMSAAPAEAPPWKALLLAGQIDPAMGERAGSVLGRMHEASASDPAFHAFADHTVFVQLRVDPFYRRVQERCPEVAGAIEPLVADLLTVKEALCHGDYTPKNMLVHGAGFTLVDYETAHLGDPTMDLGLFLCHLALKAFRDRARRTRYDELTRGFWRGYEREVRFRAAAELERRAVGHFGACLLARLDGTSPVDYLPQEPKREAVRRLARRVLRERPARWEEVQALCAGELTVFE
ncbi:MAG: aminoglycoside phosphotransferase family protein [Gemmataceae bacterium]|nr:aminoglycoside phosphotransferase family protein [Gemmataceae bacterium]